jgi:DNA (cytosine-5)-methyltransferase 1
MFRVLSLFSGAGGLDLGFERTGSFHTIACIDAEQDCVATLCRNQAIGRATRVHDFLQGARVLQADLSNPKSVLRDLVSCEVDVLVGGPPCQSFSVLGKRRGLLDTRGSLVYSYFDAVEFIRPRAFVFENVPGFASIEGGSVLNEITARARSLGYSLWSGRLCAAAYGDATVRTRFFLLGFRDVRAPSVPPQPTHGATSSPTTESWALSLRRFDAASEKLKPFFTVSEALNGLDPPEESSSGLNAHVAVKHLPRTVERFELLRPGERDVARRRNRLRPDAPGLTLFSGGVKGKKQARTHIHPFFPRELTPRECARLHSFPDYWEFSGETDSILTQVANSVPLELAGAVGRLVAVTLGGGYINESN